MTAATFVPMTKNGNVRYGPSTSALVIITLRPGNQVQLLGPAEGRAGWYEIAFPEDGGAWMHSKVLQPTGNPKEWIVTVDGASVRSDSRINAELVAQLRRGTVVRQHGFDDASGNFKGIAVGKWLKVYPTGATAFVYQSVIGLDAANEGEWGTSNLRRLPTHGSKPCINTTISATIMSKISNKRCCSIGSDSLMTCRTSRRGISRRLFGLTLCAC